MDEELVQRLTERAQKGFCPYIQGAGRVPPWSPSDPIPTQPTRDTVLATALQQGKEYANYVNMIMACADYMMIHGRWKQETHGVDVTEYQRAMYTEGFGDPFPHFSDTKGKGSAVVLARHHPERKARV